MLRLGERGRTAPGIEHVDRIAIDPLLTSRIGPDRGGPGRTSAGGSARWRGPGLYGEKPGAYSEDRVRTACDNSRVARKQARLGRPILKYGKLGTWVRDQGWNRQQLADKLGISLATASRLCSGLRRPGLELAIQIEALTRGAVPVTYWTEVPAYRKD